MQWKHANLAHAHAEPRNLQVCTYKAFLLRNKKGKKVTVHMHRWTNVMIGRYQAPFSKPLGCRHCFLSLRLHPVVVSSLSSVEQNLQFRPVATLTLWENIHLFLCWGISAKSQILKMFSLLRLPAAPDLEVSAEQVPVISRSVNV